jgi:hypothetical protein
MSKRHFALTVALALAAGFFGSLLAGAARRADGAVVTSARAAAREGEGDDGAEQKWEYCAVVKAQFAGPSRGDVYWISYFRGERMEVAPVDSPPGGNPFSKAANKLGNEGWEMVGQGPLEVRTGLPGPTPTAIFFKRRKADK